MMASRATLTVTMRSYFAFTRTTNGLRSLCVCDSMTMPLIDREILTRVIRQPESIINAKVPDQSQSGLDLQWWRDIELWESCQPRAEAIGIWLIEPISGPCWWLIHCQCLFSLSICGSGWAVVVDCAGENFPVWPPDRAIRFCAGAIN